MKLTGVHFLLTYRCDRECDHCFVWGSPRQDGTFTLRQIDDLLEQARDLGTVDWIYFEGGEPFLYYPVLVHGVRMAAESGFRVGVVSNGYWATEERDALEWLRPLAGLVQDLSISSDLFHCSEKLSQQAKHIRVAAERLDISAEVISIATADDDSGICARGKIPPGESPVRYRGRAVEMLSANGADQPWARFTDCPYEDLRDPGRVHVDPLGHVHICQGISLGNVFQTSLREICETYVPEAHPIVGPLLRGGPAGLVSEYDVPHADDYADACHLCDQARRLLRTRFPDLLAPDQMYGVGGAE